MNFTALFTLLQKMYQKQSCINAHKMTFNVTQRFERKNALFLKLEKGNKVSFHMKYAEAIALHICFE